jgi:hypothetical protein
MSDRRVFLRRAAASESLKVEAQQRMLRFSSTANSTTHAQRFVNALSAA